MELGRAAHHGYTDGQTGEGRLQSAKKEKKRKIKVA
jgi:hypothetical protein